MFPIECLGCGCPESYLCPSCFLSLEYVKKQTCLYCGRLKKNGRICIEHNSPLYSIVSAGYYQHELLSSLIKKLKYHSVTDLTDVLVKYLILFWLQFHNANKNILVVPVPLHPRRWRWRGFNQSALIAEKFALAYKYNYDQNNLIRTKNTKAQAKLKTEKREKNVKNGFKWIGPNLSGKHVIIFDDVAESGSTLTACALALKQAGAHRVSGLVLAKG